MSLCLDIKESKTEHMGLKNHMGKEKIQMELLKYKVDLQHFGEGAEGEGEVLTFDEILLDKVYQAEFDRRVQKAIDTNSKKLQEKYQLEIEELKKGITLNEESETKFKELQARYEQETNELKSKVDNTEKNYALELVIAKSGTKDPVALKAHISKFIAETEFKDGQFVGLEEHVNERKAKDLVHLFGEVQPTGSSLVGTPPKKETLQDIVEKQMGIKTK